MICGIKKCLGAMVVVWLTSCINTSYSRMDEVEVTGVEVDLIVGQFAHHGDAFYEYEIKRAKKILNESPRDFVARNDLASACIKLKKFADAESEFLLNERYHPGRYETAANLGVLYKKMGRYALAAKNVRRSLELKPGGHMGLGDYYLRMIEWLGKNGESSDDGKNFLGIPYTDPPASIVVNPVVRKEYLLTLIKNDANFPDVYLVLGDVFFSERDYQLAIRCYYRAMRLNHPREQLCYARIQEAQNTLLSMQTTGDVVGFGSVRGQMDYEFDAAELWLLEYQALEEERLKEGKSVDFKTMKSVVAAAGLKKSRVVEALLFTREKTSSSYSDQVNVFFMIAIIALILTLVIYHLCKLTTKNSISGPG